MRTDLRVPPSSLALAAALLTLTPAALATEPGLPDLYPLGLESYMTGALPPPGLYGIVYARHNNFDRLRDNRGKKIPVSFSLKANVVVPRLVWVPGVKAFGGDLVLHTIAPLVDLKVKMAGQSQSKSGLGDMVFGIGSGYHLSPQLHILPAIDVYAPTGRYRKHDLANLGGNHWAIQPVMNISYVDPTGFNGDLKLMYSINRRNNSTKYRNGQEFIADFDAGYGLGNGWVVGVGGYFYRQTTDDRLRGDKVSSNKGRSVGIGPAIKYDSGKGWFLTAKWQQDSSVRNRPEGQAFTLKAVFPL